MKKLLLLLLLLPATLDAQTVRADRFTFNTGPCVLRSGSGSPEGTITGNVCDTFWRTDTGVIYTKITGSGNTGWATVGVSGSGTANTVTKWTGTSTVGNSTTTDDGTTLTFTPGGDIFINPTGNDVFPTTNYDINLGSPSQKFLSLHIGELFAETLVAQDVMATTGGRILVAPTTLLTGDLSAGATSMTVKHNNLASGDRIYMQTSPGGIPQVEFMAVASTFGGSAGAYTYAITRDLDGTGANQWYAGDAILNTGQTGNGFIDIYSTRGVKAGTEVGPTIVGNVRLSSTYNDWSPRWAIGNLNGLYGYSGSTYGSVFGTPSGARVTIDGTNGIRIYGSDNDQKVTIDLSGNATFDGQITVGTARNEIRNSECRASTEDWTSATTSGLTMNLSFFLNPPFDFSLNGDSNTCFVSITGTPANATTTQGYESVLHPVQVSSRYETSVYLNTFRTGNTTASIQFLNAVGAQVGLSTGNACTAAAANGNALANYCRSGVIATAPAGAVNARLVITTTHNGSGTDPYVFWVRAFFGEAKVEQEDLTEWGPAGITEIIGGLIKTDAITTRTLSADSVTSAKIVAGTIVASDIAAGTITADRLNVSTLSAITANLGTITAGSISGVTATFGGAVTLDGSGVTFASGTGSANKIKWTGGTSINDSGGSLFINSADVFMAVGGGGQVNVAGGKFNVEQNIEVGTGVKLTTLGGSGATAFVCTNNTGNLYSQGSTCDGSVSPADLLQMVQELRAEVETLKAELARR